MDADPYLAAQQAAEDHLTACYMALDEEGEGGEPDWPDIQAPFCGCLTCEVRETLHAARPFLPAIAAAEAAP